MEHKHGSSSPQARDSRANSLRNVEEGRLRPRYPRVREGVVHRPHSGGTARNAASLTVEARRRPCVFGPYPPRTQRRDGHGNQERQSLFVSPNGRNFSRSVASCAKYFPRNPQIEGDEGKARCDRRTGSVAFYLGAERFSCDLSLSGSGMLASLKRPYELCRVTDHRKVLRNARRIIRAA